MKKKILVASVIILTLAIALTAFAACGDEGRKGAQGGGDGLLATTSGVYALAAVSTGELLSERSAASNVAAVSNAGYQYGKPVEDEALISELDSYMGMLDKLLGGSEPVTTEVTESDREGYAKKQVVKVYDVDGNVTEYVMYYNETVINDTDHDDDDDDRNENETDSRIEGVLEINGQTYSIRGMKETEQGESEIEFIARINDNEYIKFSQEIENGEQEFEYEIYSGGRRINSFSLEFEVENNETEIELTTSDGNVVTKYEVKHRTRSNGQVDMEIVCRKNNSVRRYDAVRERAQDGNGEYCYKYYEKA